MKSKKGNVLKSLFSTRLPLIDKEIKEWNDDIIAVSIMINVFSLCLTMHMLTLNFSQAVLKFSPKRQRKSLFSTKLPLIDKEINERNDDIIAVSSLLA